MYRKQQIHHGFRFKNIGGGLIAKDDKPLAHFTIAGEDKISKNADAEINGDTVVA